ncbi:MAG: hypothetical protein AB1898_00915 [Acidobacteriota bacterium]
MGLRNPLAIIALTAGLLINPAQLGAQADEDDGLSQSEKESVAAAKTPEDRMKLYLDIANERLKIVVSASRKGEKQSAEEAVKAFRTAVSGAEDNCLSNQVPEKDRKKLLMTLSKATRKYNFALVQALEKVPEDSRSFIQSAYEVSQRVQDGADIQLQRYK